MTSPDWQQWLKQAEHLLFNQKKLAEASSLAEQVLQVNPNCAPALQVVGLALSESGRPHEAIARLNKAVALQPDLVLGCPDFNCPGRTWDLLFCPWCDAELDRLE